MCSDLHGRAPTDGDLDGELCVAGMLRASRVGECTRRQSALSGGDSLLGIEWVLLF